MADFFTIRARSLAPAWGDYADVLQHGMSAHSGRVQGRLALKRTGPYIPPITLPGIGDVVLTSDARHDLENSSLSGFSFQPVEKVLITELRWETWNLSAEEPPQFPQTGEPEDYVLGKPHSVEAATVMGDLWEVVVPATARVLRQQRIVQSINELQLDLSTWRGDDLFRSSDYGAMLFTRRARDWFIKTWGKYVTFERLPAT